MDPAPEKQALPHRTVLCSWDGSRGNSDPLDLNRIPLDTVPAVEAQALLKISDDT